MKRPKRPRLTVSITLTDLIEFASKKAEESVHLHDDEYLSVTFLDIDGNELGVFEVRCETAPTGKAVNQAGKEGKG